MTGSSIWSLLRMISLILPAFLSKENLPTKIDLPGSEYRPFWINEAGKIIATYEDEYLAGFIVVNDFFPQIGDKREVFTVLIEDSVKQTKEIFVATSTLVVENVDLISDIYDDSFEDITVSNQELNEIICAHYKKTKNPERVLLSLSCKAGVVENVELKKIPVGNNYISSDQLINFLSVYITDISKKNWKFSESNESMKQRGDPLYLLLEEIYNQNAVLESGKTN